MDIYQETSLAIDFSKGQSIDVIVVFEGVEIESRTFDNNAHHIEEVVEFIHYNENGGCDVFF